MTALSILDAGVSLVLTIDPVGTAVVFGGLRPRATFRDRVRMAVLAAMVATTILSATACFGLNLLAESGIGFSTLRTGGGLLLLTVAWRMGTARRDKAERSVRETLVITTYLLAGPACMTTTMIAAAQARDDGFDWRIIVSALILVQSISLACLLAIPPLIASYGSPRAGIVSGAAALLLAAIAVKTLAAGLGGW